jgi:hypothetical protein
MTAFLRSRPRVRAVPVAPVLGLASLGLLLAACSADPSTFPGTQRGNTKDGGTGEPEPGDGSTGDGDGDGTDGDGDGPGDGDSDLCEVKVVPADPLAPDMLIVLDRSMSMLGVNYDLSALGKIRWTPAVSAVEKVTKDLEGAVRFGLMLFPEDGALCAAGTVHVPLGGTAAQVSKALADHPPMSFSTPTAVTLEAAANAFKAPSSGGTAAERYVLLVTDGQPTCDPGVVQAITANQEAVTHTLAAIDGLAGKGIKTYVVGFDAKSGGFAANLDSFAQHGGTEHSYDATDEASLITQLRSIAGALVPCTFELDEQPKQPSYVDVKVDGASIYLDKPNGWTLQGRTVTLVDGACDGLRDGDKHEVGIRVLCEPVTIL